MNNGYIKIFFFVLILFIYVNNNQVLTSDCVADNAASSPVAPFDIDSLETASFETASLETASLETVSLETSSFETTPRKTTRVKKTKSKRIPYKRIPSETSSSESLSEISRPKKPRSKKTRSKKTRSKTAQSEIGISKTASPEINISKKKRSKKKRSKTTISKTPSSEINVSKTASSEINVSKTASSEINVSKTAPSEIDVSKTAPSEINVSKTAPSEINVSKTAPSEIDVSKTAQSEIDVSITASSEIDISKTAPSEIDISIIASSELDISKTEPSGIVLPISVLTNPPSPHIESIPVSFKLDKIYKKSKHLLCTNPEETKKATEVMEEAVELLKYYAITKNDYKYYCTSDEGVDIYHRSHGHKFYIGKCNFKISNPEKYDDIVEILWDPDGPKKFDDNHIKGKVARSYNQNLLMILKFYKNNMLSSPRYFHALAKKAQISENTTIIVMASGNINDNNLFNRKIYKNKLLKSMNSFETSIDLDDDIKNRYFKKTFVNLCGYMITKKPNHVNVTFINSVPNIQIEYHNNFVSPFILLYFFIKL
ncbi:hypothetical protein YYC_04102 [Plasmodium yoelii 17X]|uniref:Fam-a protein n=1 Tax=Plasmodium yoelii 17X TaxID=1323249 RepID=V7PHM4_PLAYE|nr:hypothetical protein YYC_04102 [Plasmodium yoelii 17X]